MNLHGIGILFYYSVHMGTGWAQPRLTMYSRVRTYAAPYGPPWLPH